MWNAAIIHTFACSACSEEKGKNFERKIQVGKTEKPRTEGIEDGIILNETEILWKDVGM